MDKVVCFLRWANGFLAFFRVGLAAGASAPARGGVGRPFGLPDTEKVCYQAVADLFRIVCTANTPPRAESGRHLKDVRLVQKVGKVNVKAERD